MNGTSHKTIWMITGFFVFTAFVVLSIRSQPLGTGDRSHSLDIALQERDRRIEEMKTLLETDWRVRRIPTRQVVEAVSNYAQHPALQSAETFFALGLVRMYTGSGPEGVSDFEGAEKVLRTAIDMDPEWSWSHDLLGVVLFSKGNQADGLELFEHAMELDPQWIRPHSDLTILYRLDENWDMALKHALIAMDLDPMHPVPYYNYGVILYQMDRRSEAQEQFKRVLELNSDMPAPYYNIACGFAQLGQLEDSLEFLAIAIRLDPEFYNDALIDVDFDNVREIPQFQEFLEQHRP